MVIICIVAAVIVIVSIYAIVKRFGKSRQKDESELICYHTTLDCENCMSFMQCSQQYGQGLVGSRHVRG